MCPNLGRVRGWCTENPASDHQAEPRAERAATTDVPVVRDRCHVCRMWVVSRWGISDAHGETARTLIDAYVEYLTNANKVLAISKFSTSDALIPR